MKSGLPWMFAVALPVWVVTGAGCATSKDTRVAGNDPVVAAAVQSAGSVPPEKLEEIDLFFHRKIPQLQFDCYNAEVQATHKKYEGNLSVALVVHPGGKARDIKMTESTLRSLDDEKAASPNIENCVLAAVRDWEWPDVPAPAPYSGSINFKPAW